MADIPSLSSGQVGSRFVSQNDLENARARRDEQWKAAYARLGQEPPKQQVDEHYDGRSLAEKLAANKIAKQEEWEEKMKLANQFRALEEDEIMFLDSIRERQEKEERERKERDGEELKSFKEAVAARNVTSNPIPPSSSSSASKPSGPTKPTPAPAKKDAKKGLKGVVVKKKPKTASPATSATKSPETGETSTKSAEADGNNDEESKRSAKRQRTDS